MTAGDDGPSEVSEIIANAGIIFALHRNGNCQAFCQGSPPPPPPLSSILSA